MPSTLSRRTLVAGAAAGGAALASVAGPKASRAFTAPNVISRQGSNVEITFWYGLTGDVGNRIQDVISEFNALNTGVIVNGLQNTSYEDTAQQLTLALQDGSFPDAVLLPEQLWFRFYLNNNFVPMDDLISSSNFPIDDLIPVLRDEGLRQGSYYWLPLARSTSLMYYNRSLYEAAGLPGPAETYSQLREFGPALTDESQQIYAMAFDPAAWFFQGVVWGFGGNFSTDDFRVTFDEPGAVAAGQYYQDALAEGWGYMPQAGQTGADFGNGFSATGFFSTGSLTSLTTAAEQAGFEIGTAFMPIEAEGATRGASSGGSGMGIMNGISPERQQAAFAFYSHWASPETTTWWSQNTGYMPVRTSAIEGPEMTAFFEANPNFRVAVDQLYARASPSDPARRFVSSGQTVIDDALQQIMVNGAPVQEVFSAAAVQLEAESAPVIQQLEALEGPLATPMATPAT
ncbi:MAG TPA: ABC transporter substrate-binding protein [Thermomicrobiales bacterium]|jgi:sn-glycerol 3-phosphate transport system substrate-binding protein|nr:ABC transporter substrate-binding protein [Thermomicrobiales bacterium]